MQPAHRMTRSARQYHDPSATQCAGLDLAAGRGRTALAVVTVEHTDPLPLWQRKADPGPLVTDAEIVTAIVALSPAVLAIDAPLSLPARVAAALGLPTAEGAEDPTSADASPYTRAAERDPIWRELGIRPLPVSFLGGLTFRALALLPPLRASLPHSTIIEAFPSGALAAIGVRPQAGEGRRPAKTMAPARAVVQAGLRAFLRGLPDPAHELLDADALDALACALTAVAYAHGTFRAAGDEREGQIILPR